jgi:hypothetical protein
MNLSARVADHSPSSEQVLGILIEELTAKIQAGEPVDVQAYLRDHPEHGERLAQLLPALHLLADREHELPGRRLNTAGAATRMRRLRFMSTALFPDNPLRWPLQPGL